MGQGFLSDKRRFVGQKHTLHINLGYQVGKEGGSFGTPKTVDKLSSYLDKYLDISTEYVYFYMVTDSMISSGDNPICSFWLVSNAISALFSVNNIHGSQSPLSRTSCICL